MITGGYVAFKPFRKIRVGADDTVDPDDLNTLQDNIAQSLGQVLGKDSLDQKLITNIILLPGITNMVPHTLNRNLQGWFVVRTHGSYNMVYDTQDTNPSPNLLLYLMTPNQVTVDLLVF